MKLIDNAGKWHRLWSMRFTILSAFFSSTVILCGTLPYSLMATLPLWIKDFLTVGALITTGAAGISRVIKQESIK